MYSYVDALNKSLIFLFYKLIGHHICMHIYLYLVMYMLNVYVGVFVCVYRYVCMFIYLFIFTYVFKFQVESYLLWINSSFWINLKENHSYSVTCNDFSDFISLLPIKCCDFKFASMTYFSFSALFIISILKNTGLHLVANYIVMPILNSSVQTLWHTENMEFPTFRESQCWWVEKETKWKRISCEFKKTKIKTKTQQKHTETFQ